MTSDRDLRRWSEALAGMARTGLAFTESRYEQERFEEVLAVAAEMAVAADEVAPPAHQVGRTDAVEVADAWVRSVGDGVAGYVTPKVAVGAVVFNPANQILLIKRSDHGVWLYPTGWADVGYSAAEVAVKEVEEEAGIACRVERLIACFDGLRRGFSPIPLYSLVFLCRSEGGDVTPHPLECDDAGWFDLDQLPEPLASGGVWIDHALASIGENPPDPVFDPPREPVWRAP